jgi:hypothetical protein
MRDKRGDSRILSRSLMTVLKPKRVDFCFGNLPPLLSRRNFPDLKASRDPKAEEYKGRLWGFHSLAGESRLRAGMMASRLNHRGHVIPALTDHLEDKGGVIGPGTSIRRTRFVKRLLQEKLRA